jgi:hypothetical protein
MTKSNLDKGQIIEALVGDVDSFPNIKTKDGTLIRVERVTSYSQGDEVFRVVPIQGKPIFVPIGDIAALE